MTRMRFELLLADASDSFGKILFCKRLELVSSCPCDALHGLARLNTIGLTLHLDNGFFFFLNIKFISVIFNREFIHKAPRNSVRIVHFDTSLKFFSLD